MNSEKESTDASHSASERSSYSIAYQGAVGAFSHLASQNFAKQFLKEECRLIPLKHFSELFTAAQADPNTFACLPIDNSTIGSISENYDLLWPSKLSILSQFYMPIHHQLLCVRGAKIEEIEEVYSHPAALEQCRNIFKRFPRMQEQSYFDTGAASGMIRDKNNPKLAAIGSRQAAEEYALEVLLQNIEDYPQNQTRFVLVGTERKEPGASRFPCHLSFAFEGTKNLNPITALAPILGEYVSLQKIESRPVPENPWHYRLFVDLLIQSGHAERLGKAGRDKITNESIRESASALKDQIRSMIPSAKFFGLYETQSAPPM